MNAVLNPGPQLIRYEAACRALAEAKAVDEVQDVRSKADAIRIYGMQAKNKALEIDAAEIRIRAERRLGELLAQQKIDGGLNTGAMGIGTSAVPTENRTPTLAEAGIDKKLSARAQKLAAVPKDEFEAELGEWRDRVETENARVVTRLEIAGSKAAAKAPAPEQPSEIESLRAELAEARAVAAELAADLEAYAKASEGEEAAAKEIKRLHGMLRVVESQRDQYMTQNAEMKKTIAAKDRVIAKLEGKK